MARNDGTRTVQRKVYGLYRCETVCRYDRAQGSHLAWFKRYSARVTRRRLATALRREIAENDSASPAWR